MTTVRPSSRFASTRSFWTVHISARTVWRHGEQRTESTNLAIGPQRGRRRKTRRMKIDYMRRCLPLRCRRNRHQQSYAQLPSGSRHGFPASLKLLQGLQDSIHSQSSLAPSRQLSCSSRPRFFVKSSGDYPGGAGFWQRQSAVPSRAHKCLSLSP